MKVAGVITEYNPFHNGHKYQLEQIKRQTSADYIVVVMSGDFVQRGEPAIIDKYERTRMALLSGADLVLELPSVFATASAEFFAGVFVLDFVPNASVEQMKERMETFYRIIRNKHPKTPIVFIEDPIFTHTLFDQRVAHEVTRKNQTLNEIFNSLKKKGEKDIYLIHSEKMIGEDGEATVDGIHFTDLGMMRYANLITPFIKKMIKR